MKKIWCLLQRTHVNEKLIVIFLSLNFLQPDIFCLTCRWNGKEIQKLYAPEIPFYFTILRDPVDVFISAWDYTNAR